MLSALKRLRLLPPLAIWLSAIICRRLGLGLAATVVALLGMTFLPLNLGIYSLGNVDHHFAEQLLKALEGGK